MQPGLPWDPGHSKGAGRGRPGRPVCQQATAAAARRRTGATRAHAGSRPGRSRIDRPQTPGLRKWTPVPLHGSLHECSSSGGVELARLAPISTFSAKLQNKVLVGYPPLSRQNTPLGGGFVLARSRPNRRVRWPKSPKSPIIMLVLSASDSLALATRKRKIFRGCFFEKKDLSLGTCQQFSKNSDFFCTFGAEVPTRSEIAVFENSERRIAVLWNSERGAYGVTRPSP